MAAVLSITGCFKPDVSDKGDVNLLYGYWEVTHVADNDRWYFVDSEGNRSEDQTYVFSSDIVPDDGNREYYVLHMGEAYATMIAGDDPEMASILEMPTPYDFTGDKIYGVLFQGDYSKCVTVTRLDEDYLVLYQEDTGVDVSEDGAETHEFLTRTTTLRRIK